MHVHRAVLSALVALAAVLPAGAAHADPCEHVPSPCVEDVVDGLRAALDAMCSVDLCVPPYGFDALVCPILVTLAPALPAVDIRQDGDVHAGGDRVYDCPPYDNEPS